MSLIRRLGNQVATAADDALEVISSISSLAKGINTAAQTFEDKMKEVRTHRLATQKEREAAYFEQMQERRREERLRHREAMKRIMQAEKKLEASPDYQEFQEWLAEADAEFYAMINETKQIYQVKPAKLENNKPKVIENKAKANNNNNNNVDDVY